MLFELTKESTVLALTYGHSNPDTADVENVIAMFRDAVRFLSVGVAAAAAYRANELP